MRARVPRCRPRAPCSFVAPPLTPVAGLLSTSLRFPASAQPTPLNSYHDAPPHLAIVDDGAGGGVCCRLPVSSKEMRRFRSGSQAARLVRSLSSTLD